MPNYFPKCCTSLHSFFFFWQNFKVLLTQIQCAHNLSIHFLHSAAWHWNWWPWWPAGLLFPQWLCGSLRRRCEQSRHSKIDVMDQELSKTIGQHVLCFLVTPITSVGYQDLALESSAHLIVSTSGFLPVPLNFDIRVWPVPNELLGPLFDNLGFHEGSEGRHGAE